jgi:hypothetical protein
VGSSFIASTNHPGIIRYIPDLGIHACAAGHHPHCAPGCFVSSVQLEHVLNAIQVVSVFIPLPVIDPILAVACSNVTINPSVIKYEITAPNESITAITIMNGTNFIEAPSIIAP